MPEAWRGSMPQVKDFQVGLEVTEEKVQRVDMANNHSKTEEK
jgi:hypothetical protein